MSAKKGSAPPLVLCKGGRAETGPEDRTMARALKGRARKKAAPPDSRSRQSLRYIQARPEENSQARILKMVLFRELKDV